MPYEVLARKWRPQVFEDVIGQEHVTHTLMNAIKSNRLAHAYLFGGSRGVGKTSVARILAKAMNCEQGEPGVPCNRCNACVEITDGSSVDVQEIDGASNRGIDEIRELRERIKFMPSSSRFRVYIIDEVHMLTLHAFNALLKSLEEPPAHVKFIFATTETHKVPVTILSRCQRFEFKRISSAQIVDRLKQVTEEEGIEISKSGLTLIAREAEGSMRDAESLLDQVVSFTGPKVEDRHVTEILGIIDRDIIFEASRAIIEDSPKKCLEIVDQIYSHGHDIKDFYLALMDQFRNLLISLIVHRDDLPDMSEGEKDEALRQAERAGQEKLQIALNFLINREQDLRSTSHPRFILEATMIKLCRLGDFLSFGDILTKMESLEQRLLNTLATNERPRMEYASDPGAGWDSVNQDEALSDENRITETNQDWSGFLKFLSSRNKAMFNVIKDWRFLKLTEGTLEIAGSDRSFSSGYFDDKGRYDQLSDYCRHYFKRDIRISIISNKQAPSRSESPSRKNPGYPPPVQEILHMFEGEIREERAAEELGHHISEEAKRKEEVKG
ncbi:MAG: DNA polymerase III subunit gamma/tau [Thermodesulfobacteriota bacterium]|nr:DNA polymerase III subunit gamma/tau [Thermodesulfobacteriota bacterium]